MPADKHLTIATYAAGASLAAITLVYVFAPTFFLDGEATGSTASSRKTTIVGLSNPANDCFINAVLQALAGLGDLRIYLIRETHRRELDGLNLYSRVIEDPARKEIPLWKMEGLQRGTVTQGLREILNALNERPIYKKTISAGNFIKILEESFRQRISLQQQDAQEFLQVVAERLCDEYYAGKRVRKLASQSRNGEIDDAGSLQRRLDLLSSKDERDSCSEVLDDSAPSEIGIQEAARPDDSCSDRRTTNFPVYETEEGFPMEGSSESQIECQTCGFKPKPTTTTFCSLTLSVPQVSSTTLSSCFDQMFKTEYIEEFKCEKCRLIHVIETYQHEMTRSNSEAFGAKIQNYIEKIREAIDNDPEGDLTDVEMPDLKYAPKRRIARYFRITNFPKVLAIHLSRSIFDAGHSMLKNSAKVSFPEKLALGGVLNQKFYRLSSVVCHKGSHHSGHYESFRRHTICPPFSTPDTFKPADVYSKTATPARSTLSTPHTGPSRNTGDLPMDMITSGSTPEHLSPTVTCNSSYSSPDSIFTSGETSSDLPVASKNSDKRESSSLRSRARSTLAKVPSLTPSKRPDVTGASSRSSRLARSKRKELDRWWRISDDKTKESKTAEVLAMQREVYMLFYELEKDS